MFQNALFPIYYFMFSIYRLDFQAPFHVSKCEWCFLMTMLTMYMEPKKPFFQPKNVTKMIQGHLSTLRSISWNIAQTCNFHMGAGDGKIFEFWIFVFFILNLNPWSYLCANMSEFGVKKILLRKVLFQKHPYQSVF